MSGTLQGRLRSLSASAVLGPCFQHGSGGLSQSLPLASPAAAVRRRERASREDVTSSCPDVNVGSNIACGDKGA